MLPPIPVSRIAPPAAEEFDRAYLRANRPVVITGLAADWAAMRWSAESFARRFGGVRVSALPYRNGETELGEAGEVRLRTLPLRECLAANEKGGAETWFVSAPADAFPPSLKEDFAAPAYCRKGLSIGSRVFLSPAGIVTALHQDFPENLYVMLKGRKRITLFPPSAPVYPRSRLSRLPNFARLDVEKPDYERFPDAGRAQPYAVELAAGETLFIPSLWWHHLRHLEASISLNFWWARGWKAPVAWAGAAYARWRKLGNYSADDPAP